MSRVPSSKRVAVSGATGFVGSALIGILSAGQREPVALTRRPVQWPGVLVHDVGDYSDPALMRGALSDVDTIVHLAARVHVMAETGNADALAEYRSLNVHATRELARAAAGNGIRRFIFMSSIKVLGEETDQEVYSASSTPGPGDPYGVSKMEAEQALWKVSGETGMEVVVIRPPLVYGPGVKANFARLMGMVHKGVPLPLGAVHNRRSMIGLDNLVDLIIRCIDAPEAAGQTFLASDGRDLSTPELIRLIANAMGKSPRLIPVPESALRLLGALTGKRAEVDRLCGSLQVDISLTRETLGWEPPVSVEEGIQKTVDAFLAQQRGTSERA